MQCSSTRCALVLAACAAALTGGCVQSRMHEGSPEDFALQLVVYDAGVSPQEAGEPLNIIVTADGSLRAESGDQAWAGSYPTITRQLTDREMANLWDLTGPLRTEDPLREQIANPLLEFPPEAGTAFLVWIRALEDERSFRFVEESGAPETIAPLIDRLLELAWMK